MFRTIGILRRVTSPWWPLNAFWKRGISRTSGRFTPPSMRPVLISVPDDPNSLQIRAADDPRHSCFQRSVCGRALLLRPSQCCIATGIFFRDTRHPAAKTGAHLVQSALDRSRRAVDAGFQIAHARFCFPATGFAEGCAVGCDDFGHAAWWGTSDLLLTHESKFFAGSG